MIEGFEHVRIAVGVLHIPRFNVPCSLFEVLVVISKVILEVK